MSPAEISRVCYAAAEIISVPERWAWKDYALNRWGGAVNPTAIDAVCWCARGAVWRVAESIWFEVEINRLVSQHQDGWNLDEINDHRGREPARAALLRTATLYAEEQGGHG